MSSRWREPLREAIALRLGLWYFALFVLSAAGLLLLSYHLVARTLATQDHDVVADLLHRYASEHRRGGVDALRDRLESDAEEGRHERLLLRALTRSGEVLFSDDLSTSPAPLDDALRRRLPWVTLHAADGASVEVGTVWLPDGVALQVGRSSAVRDTLLSNFRAAALELSAGVILLALVGGLVITSVALAPVRALESTVGRILATGRYDARVQTRGTGDPLDRLSDAINRMLARIDALVTGMRGTIDNLAHDLRTPLTRFRAVAERALVEGRADQALDALGQAVEEGDRLGETLTALMDISEAETGSLRLQRTAVDVARIIDDAVDLFADEAEDKGLAISTRCDRDVVARGDGARLRQVCANVIENAVKYTPVGGRIDVVAAREDAWVVVSVRDSGMGIEAGDLPHVFDRLYRAESSRSTRGLGLGLTLVRAIVEAHGGAVSATSAPGQGTCITVRVPVWSETMTPA